MTPGVVEPFWASGKQLPLDRLAHKHEFYGYDRTDARVIPLDHFGRSIQLIALAWFPPVRLKDLTIRGPLLFLIGEQLDDLEPDGRVIAGGDGLLVIATGPEDPGEVDRFAVLVWHSLYPQAIRLLALNGDDIGEIPPQSPPLP